MATITEERAAFEAQLDELMKTHAGKWVVFHDLKLHGVYDDAGEAYRAGEEAFGEEPFLLTCVERRGSESVSIAWTAGVMFG
jgi:hypothetical protein